MSKYFNLAFSVNAFHIYIYIYIHIVQWNLFGRFACIDADNLVFLLCSVRLKVSGCVFLPLKTATAATGKYVCIRGLHLHLFKLICISIRNPTQLNLTQLNYSKCVFKVSSWCICLHIDHRKQNSTLHNSISRESSVLKWDQHISSRQFSVM